MSLLLLFQNNLASATTYQGQWPHLDQLFGNSNIDVVCFDNYLPLSDWTTFDNGLDPENWQVATYTGTWPPSPSQMNGLGLTGVPTLYSKPYLKANIEGGEKYNWFYGNSVNLGIGPDPSGSGQQVSLPQGDRLSQTRSQYYTGQDLLAPKRLRWWWSNTHQAVYGTNGGAWTPQGNPSKWVAKSKSINFTEYGFPSCDKATNQPNVFWDSKSTESATPFWSKWVPAAGGTYKPAADSTLSTLALQAVYEYWFTDTPSNNDSLSGVVMVDSTFSCVWAWDARPFPAFPKLSGVWADAGNWQTGNWVGGKGPSLTPPPADTPPAPASYTAFPTLAGLGWSVKYTPTFVTTKTEHVSGRSSRASRASTSLLQIEITIDFLRMGPSTAEYEALAGFFAARQGKNIPFTFPVPSALGLGTSINARFDDDKLDFEQFMSRLWSSESIKIRQVKGE